MTHDRMVILEEIIKKILETDEAKAGKKNFELSKLQVDFIFNGVLHSLNGGTLNQYWKLLIWKKFIISVFQKHESTLQRQAQFGLFDKEKCLDLFKKEEVKK